MRRGDGKGEGSGGGGGGAAWVAAREAGMVVVARVVRAAAVETVVRRAVAVRRSKDSGNGGDLWVMLEECSVCFGKRKEEHGRL